MTSGAKSAGAVKRRDVIKGAGIGAAALAFPAVLTPRKTRAAEQLVVRDPGGPFEKAFQEARFSTVPLRRGGTAHDCATVIRFLLSDESAYITGADINISGGLVTW